MIPSKRQSRKLHWSAPARKTRSLIRFIRRYELERYAAQWDAERLESRLIIVRGR